MEALKIKKLDDELRIFLGIFNPNLWLLNPETMEKSPEEN